MSPLSPLWSDTTRTLIIIWRSCYCCSHQAPHSAAQKSVKKQKRHSSHNFVLRMHALEKHCCNSGEACLMPVVKQPFLVKVETSSATGTGVSTKSEAAWKREQSEPSCVCKLKLKTTAKKKVRLDFLFNRHMFITERSCLLQALN